MRVFLTGGTGLLGSHAAERLRADGHGVVALVRATSERAHLRGIGCVLVEADLAAGAAEADDTAAAADLARLMAGCDALVHAAALVGRTARWSAFQALNVDATRRVFEAGRAAGVRRAVHVSSVAVYGGLTDAPVTEDRWQERPVAGPAYYARSKRLAEEVAWRFHEPGRLRVSTVRPCVVYGERDRHLTPRLDGLMRLPLLPFPDGGRHPLPLVYAGNVALGIVRCLERDEAGGRAYNLTGDAPLSGRRLVEVWCRERSLRPPRIVPLPGGALVRVAEAIDGATARLPGVRLPRLGRPARLLRAPQPYDSTRARRELDWAGDGLVSAEAALERTAEWWLQARG